MKHVKIDPIRQRPGKDVALLFPSHRRLTVQTKWGVSRFTSKRDIDNAMLKLRDHVCYVTSGLQILKATTGARDWVLTTWHGRDVKMTHVASGVTVTSLRHSLDGSDDPFVDLMAVMKWLRGYQVRPASISGMAWQLFRASLTPTEKRGATDFGIETNRDRFGQARPE